MMGECCLQQSRRILLATGQDACASVQDAEDEKHCRIWKTGPSYIMFEGRVQRAYGKVKILTKVWPKNLSYDMGLALWYVRRERKKNWHHASYELVPSCHCNKYPRSLMEGRAGNVLSSGREFDYRGENKERIYFGSWFQSCCFKPLKITHSTLCYVGCSPLGFWEATSPLDSPSISNDLTSFPRSCLPKKFLPLSTSFW